MTQTALWPLQQAIFQRLTNDTQVTDIVKGVFDAVPEDQLYPYLVIGDPVSDPFDTKTTTGEQIAIVIHAWSDYPGKKEAYEILNACLQATSRRLQLEGNFKIILQERTNMTVFDDIDGKIRHGILRLRFTINNT